MLQVRSTWCGGTFLSSQCPAKRYEVKVILKTSLPPKDEHLPQKKKKRTHSFGRNVKLKIAIMIHYLKYVYYFMANHFSF